MYNTASAPQYAFGPTLAPVPMPMYKRGGEVKETYGLENAAEMIRRQGRDGDTVLAHINPEEAGILKLLGGSGTTNPYTGLPEFKLLRGLKKIPVIGKPLYKLGSEVGQAIEGGIESIARNKILGPIAQMASYLHPVSAFLYAGLAPEGSSFDVKGAAKAAAMQQIGQAVKDYAIGTPSGGGGIGAEGASMSNLPYGAGDLANQQFIDNAAGFVGDPIYQPSSIGAVESAVSSAGSAPFAYTPDPNSYVSGAPAYDPYASAGTPTVTDVPAAAPPPTSSVNPYDVDNIGNVSESRVMGDYGYGSAPVETYNLPRAEDASGIRGLDPAGENFLGAAGSLAEGAYDLAVSNPKTAATAAYMGYTAYQTKKELDAARDEANRILADRENKKKEEIEWAQGVLRDYPYNYQRLTEEDVRRERGMAMGGRINSYDDEPGMDDGMMQGGIASLAKGGLPPRYLRGGGDGMSDSIRARIGGKQEARLADGEFVVPADVVSHLGNGSSNAGAKRLYEMMNRVRKSRTGKTRQAPEVNTRKMMPV
jgi:hypothetical protein